MKNLTYFFAFLLILTNSVFAEESPEALPLEGNGKITITAVIRKNEIVTIKGNSICDKSPCAKHSYLENAYLLDEERGVKYFPIKDSKHYLLASDTFIKYSQKKTKRFWVKFTAPPEEIKTIDLYLVDHEPLEGLTIIDK
jgi:hypothetical protein